MSWQADTQEELVAVLKIRNAVTVVILANNTAEGIDLPYLCFPTLRFSLMLCRLHTSHRCLSLLWLQASWSPDIQIYVAVSRGSRGGGTEGEGVLDSVLLGDCLGDGLIARGRLLFPPHEQGGDSLKIYLVLAWLSSTCYFILKCDLFRGQIAGLPYQQPM